MIDNRDVFRAARRARLEGTMSRLDCFKLRLFSIFFPQKFPQKFRQYVEEVECRYCGAQQLAGAVDWIAIIITILPYLIELIDLFLNQEDDEDDDTRNRFGAALRTYESAT